MTVGKKSMKETEKNYKKWERPREETGKNQENKDFKEKGNTGKTHERY